MNDVSIKDSFEEIVSKYQIPFTRFANSYVRDFAVAEDFTMESFMDYWEKRESLRDNSNIPAYILTIVKNKCLNYLKHIEIKDRTSSILKENAIWELNIRIASLQDCNPNELLSNEVYAIVKKTMQAMPKQTRKVFFMSRVQNKTHKEISEYLGISTKGVEFHITKALKLLHIELKDYYPLIILLFFNKN